MALLRRRVFLYASYSEIIAVQYQSYFLHRRSHVWDLANENGKDSGQYCERPLRECLPQRSLLKLEPGTLYLVLG